MQKQKGKLVFMKQTSVQEKDLTVPNRYDEKDK